MHYKCVVLSTWTAPHLYPHIDIYLIMPVRIKLVRRLPPARSPQSLSSSPASSSQQTSSSNEAGDLVEANEGADEESGSSGGTSNSDETSVRSVAGADFQGIPIETALAELQQRLEVLEQRNLQRNLLGLPTLDSDSDSESLPTTDKMQIEVSFYRISLIFPLFFLLK